MGSQMERIETNRVCLTENGMLLGSYVTYEGREGTSMTGEAPLAVEHVGGGLLRSGRDIKVG